MIKLEIFKHFNFCLSHLMVGTSVGNGRLSETNKIPNFLVPIVSLQLYYYYSFLHSGAKVTADFCCQLQELQLVTLPLPPYSPALAPTDFTFYVVWITF